MDESKESDFAHGIIQGLRREHQLGKDLFQGVPNYSQFKIGLEKIKYAGVYSSEEAEDDESVSSVGVVKQVQGLTEPEDG